jgi:hypothetical protein
LHTIALRSLECSSASQINDPFVLRALVNTASIERTLLFETRAEASEVLNTMRGGGVGYTGDGFNVRNFGYVLSLDLSASWADRPPATEASSRNRWDAILKRWNFCFSKATSRTKPG